MGQQFIVDDFFIPYLPNTVKSAFSSEQVTLQQLELLVKKFQNTSPGHVDLCISLYEENFVFLGETLLAICDKSLSQEFIFIA